MKTVYSSIPRILCLGIPLTMYLFMLNMDSSKFRQKHIDIPKYIPSPPSVPPENKLVGAFIKVPQHIWSRKYFGIPFFH